MLYNIDIPQYAWAEYIGQLVPITHAVTFAVLRDTKRIWPEKYICEDGYLIITMEKLFDYSPMLGMSILSEVEMCNILEDLEACGMIKYDISDLDEEILKNFEGENCVGRIKITELSDKLYSDTDYGAILNQGKKEAIE